MQSSYIYIAFAIYFVVGTLVALYARRGLVQGMESFFLANRAVNGVVAALTYSATTYSAFMMVGLAGLTYTGGVGAWGFELIYLSGLVLVAFFGPRFWIAGKKYHYITPTEMLGDRYDNKALSVVAALASVVFLIPYSAVQLIGIGTLLEMMSQGSIPYITGLVLATLLAIIWAWMGGMRTVAWTDSLQALLMVVAATLSILFLANRAFGGFGGLFSALETGHPQWLSVPGPGFFSLPRFIGMSLPWFFFSLSNPQVSQRLFIPRSLGNMRIMIIGFLVFGFIYTLISILWGFSARVLLPELSSGDMATPLLLTSGYIPAIVALVVMVGITAAAISTVNSILLSLSSMISRDVVKNLNHGVKEDLEIIVGKLFIPIFAIVTLLFATMRLNIIAILSVASSAGLLVTVPSIIGAFFWKRGTAAGSIASIVIGGFVAFLFEFGGLKPLGWFPGVWSILVSSILFIIVSLVTSPPARKAEEFINYINNSLKGKNAI